MNGGVLATLADMACALALCTHFDGRMPFATSDLHIRYLEPVQEWVEFRASVVRSSARSAVLECRAHCGNKVMAQATASFTIRNRPGEAP
jgi:acyl-coenzyme A thioesterase PaaI-like protein